MMKDNCFVFRMFLRKTSIIGALVAVLSLVGCGGSEEHHHEDHEHEGHEHVHHAPHGGALGMLGDHAFQIEIVPDAEAGTVDLYVLDGEAENFIRITAATIEAKASAGEKEWDLRFQAVANEATGETVGNSSHFSVQAPELVEENEFVVTFGSIELLGLEFDEVRIPYPEGSH